MKAIVAGATGLVGMNLVKSLLEDGAFSEVVVFVRKPFPLEHPKLKIVTGELSKISSFSSELKGDVYFSCLGTTIKTAGSQDNFRKVDFHGVVSFGRLAFSHNAQKFIVISASGAHSQSKIFYNRVKGETEKALKDLGLRALVIFRPGLLVGQREEKRTGEKMAVQSYRVLRHILPVKASKTLATEVPALVERMISESKAENPGLHIIESKDI